MSGVIKAKFSLRPQNYSPFRGIQRGGRGQIIGRRTYNYILKTIQKLSTKNKNSGAMWSKVDIFSLF
jgi:hypothetical protein